MFITYVHCIFIFIYIHVSLPYRESTLYIATCNISRSSFTQPICLFFCEFVVLYCAEQPRRNINVHGFNNSVSSQARLAKRPNYGTHEPKSCALAVRPSTTFCCGYLLCPFVVNISWVLFYSMCAMAPVM